MQRTNRLLRGHFNSAGLPKTAYLCLDDALEAAARMEIETGKPYDAYRCECAAWHIGGKSAR